MLFNLGIFFCALPVIAFATGTVSEVNDGAFYIVLALLFGLGAFLINAAIRGSEKLIADCAAGAGMGELWAVVAILTLSVPIALLIKRWRRKHATDL